MDYETELFDKALVPDVGFQAFGQFGDLVHYAPVSFAVVTKNWEKCNKSRVKGLAFIGENKVQ